MVSFINHQADLRGPSNSKRCPRSRAINISSNFLTTACTEVGWTTHYIQFSQNCTEVGWTTHYIQFSQNCTEVGWTTHYIQFSQNCTEDSSLYACSEVGWTLHWIHDGYKTRSFGEPSFATSGQPHSRVSSRHKYSTALIT